MLVQDAEARGLEVELRQQADDSIPALDGNTDAMAQQRDRELEDPSLRKPAKRALESLRNQWEGCILFVDHPEIPMDNNKSEHRLRDPAVGRKNYYGSGSVWK